MSVFFLQIIGNPVCVKTLPQKVDGSVRIEVVKVINIFLVVCANFISVVDVRDKFKVPILLEFSDVKIVAVERPIWENRRLAVDDGALVVLVVSKVREATSPSVFEAWSPSPEFRRGLWLVRKISF